MGLMSFWKGGPEAAPDPQANERAKRVARSGSASERRDAAANPNLSPELLYFLAQDNAPEVRRAAAENRSTPPQADLLLTQDDDGDIRGALASKVGGHLKDQPGDADPKVLEMVHRTLDALASDQLATVRAVIAQEIKQLDTVPVHVVQRLARDAETVVCGPVLEHSPLLDDAELIDIIRSGADEKAVAAIANRRDLDGAVSNAVVETGSETAVHTLLMNMSAKIEGSTMETIVEQAAGADELHGALAGRPDIPPHLTNRVAEVIGEQLLDQLLAQYKLDDTVVSNLRSKVRDGIKTKRPVTRQRVLVVDDDVSTVTVLEELLHSMGRISVTRAHDGESPLMSLGARAQGIDLVICDWMMPKVSGIDVLREIRTAGIKVPFVMITARTDAESVQQAKELGVDVFIAKPVSGAGFREAIAQYLG